MNTPSTRMADDWWAKMPKEQSGYRKVVTALKPILYGLPGRLVVIDGKNGVGKSTLGRFLSWKFNSSLVETDLFIKPPGFNYFEAELGRIIHHRLAKPRPVFVEGMAVLWVLDRLQLVPDYHIYVRNIDPSDSNIDREDEVGQSLMEYESAKDPVNSADHLVDLVLQH